MSVREKPKSPEVGDTFAVSLENGLYTACRVLRSGSSDQPFSSFKDVTLVASADWFGDHVPSIDEPRLRKTLRLNHHTWTDRPNVRWVPGRPPKQFKKIGHIPPTAEDLKTSNHSFDRWDIGLTAWNAFQIQPLLQWRWDHDREALEAEDRIEKAEEARKIEEAKRDRSAYLSTVTLNQLLDKTRFAHWRRLVKPKPLAKSRDLFSRAIGKLISIGRNATEESKLNVLRELIEGFNSLDAEFTFIETEEREDICLEVDAIAHACGLAEKARLVDRWREW